MKCRISLSVDRRGTDGNNDPIVHLLNVVSSSYAPSNLFVLLGWCSGLYTVCLESNPKFIETLSWKSLVGSMAILLDMVYDSDRAKPSLKKGALVRVRRALRSVCSLPFNVDSASRSVDLGW